MYQACTSTRRGSASGSGMARVSGTAGNSEGIVLAESVALAEDMAKAGGIVSAEAGGIVSAEDIAEGIGSSGCPSLNALVARRRPGGRTLH
jgi:hypothetical protein